MISKKEWIDTTAYNFLDRFNEYLSAAWDNGRLEEKNLNECREYKRGDIVKTELGGGTIYLFITESLNDFVGAFMTSGSYIMVRKSDITYANKTYDNIKNFFADYENK